MIAARKRDVGIVRKLIQHGTSANLTNKVSPVSLCLKANRSNLPIHWLVGSNFPLVFMLILKNQFCQLSNSNDCICTS